MKLCRLIGSKNCNHSIEEVTVDQALEMLSTDQSLAEVIPSNNRDIIKPYFDIDDRVSPYSMKEIVLERSLQRKGGGKKDGRPNDIQLKLKRMPDCMIPIQTTV